MDENLYYTYTLTIPKKKFWFIIKSLAVIVIFTLSYFVAYSYRYERFKDGHKYMRYDKWLDKYEKYHIPTKTWKEL